MAADRTTRRLLVCGVIGPVLFVGTFTILGAIRAGYDPARTFVSELAFGDEGWQQAANFLIAGSLLLAFAFGLGRDPVRRAARWPATAISVVGLGLIIAGTFRDGPGHAMGAALIFLGLPSACIVFGASFWAKGQRTWAAGSVACGLAMLVLYIAALAGSGTAVLAASSGWLQRASIVTGFGWLAAFAVKVIREPHAVA